MTTNAPDFTFVFPGDSNTLTGGYTYGRRIIEACRTHGATVTVIDLPSGYPDPHTDVLAETDRIIADIPDNTMVVFDGLAYGALPLLAAEHAERLRLVALVHHPLADETGLSPHDQLRLFESERLSLSHTQAVIVSSPFTKARLQDFGIDAKRCMVVEPGIDDAPFNEVRKDADTVRMLYVASLTERKGHLDLFEALHSLRDLSWTLDLVGPDDLAPDYAAMVLQAAKPFGTAVQYHGPLPESDLVDLYRKADLYVSPAKYEGYGMALATAVVYGLPIIAVDGGAVASTPAGHAARLVSADDTAGFALSLQRAITEPEKRTRLAAQSRAARAQLTDWTEAGRKFLDALDAVGSRANNG